MDTKILYYIFFGAIIAFALILIAIAVYLLSRRAKYVSTSAKIVAGNIDGHDPKRTKKKIMNPEGSFAKRLKKNSLVKLYKEYIFFKGKTSRLVAVGVLGYAVFLVAFYFLSKSVPLAIIFSFSWGIILYIIIDGRTGKKRKKYIKGFSTALKTISASVEAGNTFQVAVQLILNRDTTSPRVKEEFALLNNDLKTNKSIEEALESFYKRNNMFQEISLFVVTIQFFFKKGGENLSKVLVDIEKAFEKKIENYSEIDTELGINKMLMNVLIYGYLGMFFVLPLFMPTFYPKLIEGDFGILKALGSQVLFYFGVIFFRNQIRRVAEE